MRVRALRELLAVAELQTIETEFVPEWRANFLESGLLHAAIVVEMDVSLMQKGPASLPGLSYLNELNG